MLPCGVTPAVDAGHRCTAVEVVGPFPLSVLSESDAPEPAVEGAAMGSAMAPSEWESVWFVFCLVGYLIELN